MVNENNPVPSDLNLDQVKSELLEQRSGIELRLAAMKKPPERGASIGFGKRIGDGTSEAVSRITEVALADNLEVTVSRIDRALEKIDGGSYGTCDDCGQPIATGRLRVSPASSLCIECARRQV